MVYKVYQFKKEDVEQLGDQVKTMLLNELEEQVLNISKGGIIDFEDFSRILLDLRKSTFLKLDAKNSSTIIGKLSPEKIAEIDAPPEPEHPEEPQIELKKLIPIPVKSNPIKRLFMGECKRRQEDNAIKNAPISEPHLLI
jgi:hypothetical protein